METIIKQIEDAIEELYSDNQSKLRQICDKEMRRFGGISQMEFDNFYSRAGLELSKMKKRYENTVFVLPEGKTIRDYIYGVIKKSIYKEMTDKNRKKRQIVIETEEEDENGNLVKKKEYIHNISIDAPIGDDENCTISDIIADKFSIEKEIFEDKEEGYSKKMLMYLSRLSNLQREILKLIIAGYLPGEIREQLHISEKEYVDCYKAIHSYRNISLLF